MAKQPDQPYTLSGRITDPQSQPIEGLIVRAFDQDPTGENPLGLKKTDAEGKYSITYTDADFRIGGKESGGADIIVRVYDGENLLAETKPRRNARRNVTINVTVEEQAQEEPSKPVLTARQELRLRNLSGVLKIKKLQTGFEAAFKEAKGDWQATLDALRKKGDFEEKVIEQLVFSNQVAELTEDNTPLIKAFHSNNKTNSLRDIALNFNRAQLKELAKSTAVPEDVEGDDEEQKLKKYTGKIYAKLFQEEPTATVLRMVADPAETPFADKMMSGTVATFLSHQPATFNIKTTSIYEAFKVEDAFKDIDPDLQDGVVTQLKALQRVATMSPIPEAMPLLMKTNMTTALRVSDMPEAQFVKAFAKELGDEGEAIAKQIHANAVNTRIRNEQALIALKEAGQGTGVAFIDKSLNTVGDTSGFATRSALPANYKDTAYEIADAALEKNNLSWDLLFGDADFCECGECTSVYSAAAYFVDLLQYLRNNNLDPDATGTLAIKTNPRDISGTPLEKLLNRRPDLGCLELTCKNTNTILPYIDLVNEVMENYIVYHHTKAFNVEEDQTSGELLAQPQHTEYEAYCILHKAVYPFTLPYHQPIDAARIYLDHLGTSRHELIDVFRSPRKGKEVLVADGETETAAPIFTDAEKKELDQLHEDYINRAVDAEYLGLTQEEYVILTKEAFVSKTYWDKQCQKDHSEEEYHQRIGLKPVHAYYGYDTEVTMLDTDESAMQGLTFVKDQFLRRTGIAYTDLVELLKTQCLNPNMPQGKALSLMQGIQFSYRFLQDLVDYGANSPKGKYEKLVKFLKEAQPFIPLLEAMLHPDPCNADNIDFCVETKDLEQWVYYYFERIGKIIVLENGASCINGNLVLNQYNDNKEIDYKSRPVIKIKNCKLIVEKEGAQLIVATINSATGLITFSNTIKDGDKSDIFNFQFQGEHGEIGKIIKHGDKFFLVNEKTGLPFSSGQSDNCDLDTVRLIHLDGSPVTVDEYDNIHRFIRLWRKLGWTIDELDQALVGLGNSAEDCMDDLLPGGNDCDDTCSDLFEEADNCADASEDEDCFNPAKFPVCRCEITPDFLRQLVAVKKLMDKSGLELIRLLAFWTNISTFGEKSLYKRLFLTHNLIRVDDVLKADKNGNYLTRQTKVTNHQPVLMAAFNLSSDDLFSIMDYSRMEDELTLANLSLIYRYRLLARVIGVRIPDFISILPLFGDPFKNAHTTLEFMERWGGMEDTGFTYRQLNYVIRDYDEPKKPLAPTQKTVLQLAKTLYDGINAIEEAHKDVKPEDEVTTDIVRAKAVLLFDPVVVERIAGIIEGANVFITNAPKSLVAVSDKLDTKKDDPANPVSDVITALRKKIKYDAVNGSIQVMGILTLAETTEYKTWSNDPKWSEALTRIEKQQNKRFKEVLFDVFESEKQKSPERKAFVEEAEKILKEGDVSVPIEQIAEEQEDPNTAPGKRRAFLQVFLPYLRQQLTHRFVVDTLSGSVGLEREITDVLISEVLISGTPPEPVYHVFEGVKESAVPTGANWGGYLIPSADASYTFIVKDSDNPPIISLDGVGIAFIQQEDPTNEWWSTPIKLQAGKLYQFSLGGIELKNLQWKTPTSAIAAIPASQLLPDFASESVRPALIMLQKAAIVVTGFNLGADEIRYLNTNKGDFDALDFNQLTLTHWLRLDAYIRLRNSLPSAQINILDFFRWAKQPDDAAKLSEKITELTLWKKERIDQLVKEGHFNLNRPEAFLNEQNLLKFQKALQVADKVGMDIDLLFDWAKPTSNFKKCRGIAESIQKAIRAQYKQEDWEQVVKPLNDQLRNNQRDALIAYLLQQPDLIRWGVYDADGLFEYFLIDVQMDACMETSRIKQAISSVQTFVQRCNLGLEEEHNGITADILDRDRWEWMQRYRVWEANRKVFLYPENWIESNLRDDKSPFFKELESELLQKDINKQNVTDALKAYLYKVDEVANMEVVGLYIDGTKNGQQWPEGSKIHVFSRTRNAPYFFYYRYLALDEMNWYPWEKIQVDIPSYDVENSKGHITDNGCYLTPVVWNGRLFLFFPQIVKKTEPVSNTVNVPAPGSSTTLSNPKEYWEIKLAYSELRNGKWTQKRLSTDALIISKTWSSKVREINHFTFIPIIYADKIIISVEDQMKTDTNPSGSFTFSSDKLYDNKTNIPEDNLPSPVNSEFGSTDFQKVNNRIKSMQVNRNAWGNNRATFTVYPNRVEFEYQNISIPSLPFYHSFIKILLGQINHSQLDSLFTYNLDSSINKAEAFGANSGIYKELKSPYAIYNWELFFHTPMMLADALSKAQQFEEAMKWYHFVFNPLGKGIDDKRFWQFLPFKEIDAQRILDNIFNNLQPNQSDEAINEWRNHPFMPHVVARSRPVAYMKWVVMKYIDNLVAWGDYLFRQDTIESINQATQLYILAGHILGPRPQLIPKRGKIQPRTYLSLLDKWDAFSNAFSEMEIVAPFSNQITTPIGVSNGVAGFANVFGFGSSLYFCIPNNPKLMGYWDTIADRLFKIRHCQNIEGVFRKLPLFEPPIDPALLVKAAAQGLSIASVLNDLSTPMPNYRFYYLLQKALELCTELKSLGNSLLSAIEKKDNEAIVLMRARNESTMHNLVMEIKKKQLEEAQKSLETLQQNRRAPEHRMKYYLQLIGEDVGKVPGFEGDFNEIANAIEAPVDESGLKLIRFEKEDMDKASAAADWQIGIGAVETLASIFHALPTFTAAVHPLGVGADIQWGFSHLANATSAVGRGLRIYADNLSYQSSRAGKKGGFTRAIQDRIMQANAAGYEVKQIDKQVVAQEIRINIANQEIANQQKQIDNALEVEEFLKNKYTNEELYTWMRGSLKTLYYQVYSLAYELAKKAEKVFRFERGLSNSSFIQAGYWDAGRDGLLAGEQLYVGLKQLEAAYQENRGYDYEITKHISLRQINPMALLQLKETGKCEFALPELLFDMDYPGHFKRRVKSVSLSIPCVAGPYTGLNATLRLLENKFRNASIAKDKADYLEKTEESDERFSTFIIPITSIAASSAQNDSGMFELNFKDERYLPFEGAGAISKWRLELPAFRQFDYNTISDAVIHLRYTAREGGERLKKAANDTVLEFTKSTEELGQEEGLFAIIDLKHDLSNEWHKAMQVKEGDTQRTLSIAQVQNFLPFYVKMDEDGKPRDINKVKITDVVLLTHSDLQATDVVIIQGENEVSFIGGVSIGTSKTFVIRDEEIKVGDWKLVINNTEKSIEKVLMVVRFILK